MTADEARRRFAGARVAHLATVDRTGRPHVVPLVFAVDGHTIVSAVDHKPKRGPALRRVANISSNPQVSVLVDHYSENWDELWWARADGTAMIVEPDSEEGARSWARLAERYEQYEGRSPAGPVIVVDVERWSGWSAVDALPH